MKEEFDRKTKEMQKTSELLQALTTGVSAQEGQENGYLEQLQGKKLSDRIEQEVTVVDRTWIHSDAKNTANRASTTEEQARIKIKHLEKDLEEKTKQVSKTERQNNTLQNDLAAKLKDKAEQTVSCPWFFAYFGKIRHAYHKTTSVNFNL